MKILVQIIESPRTRWRVAPTVFAEHVRRLASALAAEFTEGPRPLVEAIVEERAEVPAGAFRTELTNGQGVFAVATMTRDSMAAENAKLHVNCGGQLYWRAIA
jgi:hypothetical protein